MTPVENSAEVTELILVGITNDQSYRSTLHMFPLIYLVTLIGNLKMTKLLLLDSVLHTPMYFFFSDLCLVDFGYSTAMAPRVIADSLKKARSFPTMHVLVRCLLLQSFSLHLLLNTAVN